MYVHDFFYIWNTNGMMLFCNLFIEWPWYKCFHLKYRQQRCVENGLLAGGCRDAVPESARMCRTQRWSSAWTVCESVSWRDMLWCCPASHSSQYRPLCLEQTFNWYTIRCFVVSGPTTPWKSLPMWPKSDAPDATEKGVGTPSGTAPPSDNMDQMPTWLQQLTLQIWLLLRCTSITPDISKNQRRRTRYLVGYGSSQISGHFTPSPSSSRQSKNQ